LGVLSVFHDNFIPSIVLYANVNCATLVYSATSCVQKSAAPCFAQSTGCIFGALCYSNCFKEQVWSFSKFSLKPTNECGEENSVLPVSFEGGWSPSLAYFGLKESWQIYARN
jgi:hypothetical protein